MPQFTTTRRVRHSAENMFDLVADVERYPEFVPLCRDLKVRKREDKDDGVQVNCIHPSLVETERQWRRIRAEIARTGESEDKVRADLARETGITRFGTVEDVADLVTFMVSRRATWLHGATIDLDGGEIPVL